MERGEEFRQYRGRGRGDRRSAAVEERCASLEVGYPAFEHRHALLAGAWAGGDGFALLTRLASEEEAARVSVEALERSMPTLEIWRS